MLNIVLFGPPGSGKGTQSARIIKKYNLAHLSTGDIMREEMANKTELGQTFRKYIDKGMLVPDDIVLQMLYDRGMASIVKSGMIFDGFPRTLVQAKKLDQMLEKNDSAIDLVLSVEVSEDEIFQRLMGRGEDSGRSDDKDDIIKQRIEVYKSQTFPLIDYYKSQKKFVSTSGMYPVDVVFIKICTIIDTYIKTGERIQLAD